jgi:peptidoglycan/xylan/chitin deacetylase (PgdA/CDA1 family)
VLTTAREIVEIGGGAALVAGAAAAGLMYASVWPSSQLFGHALTAPRLYGNGLDEIAFTFDDGPNPRWTPLLLELLAKHNVRATFFLIGQYAAAQKSLVRETLAAGHLIGNHTWTHPNLARTSPDKTRDELKRTSAELEQITGGPIHYFRPPFGLRRPATFRIARELGLIPVTWTVIGNDWNAESAQQITDRVTRLAAKDQQRGCATNLVLHDGSHRTPEADRSRTVASMKDLLEIYAPSRRFVTLDEWEN